MLVIGIGSLFFIRWMKELGEDYVKSSRIVEEYSLEVRVCKKIKRGEAKEFEDYFENIIT